eukprot:TRINITY_DN3559_c0_g1_i1.p1 TRINITY_DN3559_c0_g1~~TRINITY_DN3559_c0_g1_i1.p1  ORF type:complete len:599 (-),score=196.91 TRINITY_DN3559_c0_g1_i1:114-1877(-)
MFSSSRKRLHSTSPSPSETSYKRRRPSEPEGYLEYCWRKICSLFGLPDEMEQTSSRSYEPDIEDDDPVIVASSSSVAEEVEIVKEMKPSRPGQAVFSPLRSRAAFTVSTKEKRLKDKELNAPSSILDSLRSPSLSSQRNYSIHQNVFHPKLGKSHRRSFLRQSGSPFRPNRSPGVLTSIRLEEKDRYRKLISAYGTQSIQDLLINNGGSSPIAPPSRKPIVDLLRRTHDESEDKGRSYPIAESTPIIRQKDPDLFIERIIKKKPLSPSPLPSKRVNSLDVELAKSPSSEKDFLQKLLEKYSSRTRERERQIQILSAKKDYYEEKNNKSCRIIEDRIKKHLAITEVEVEVPSEEEKSSDEEEEKLPDITDEMNIVIAKAYNSDGRTITRDYGTDISRKDIETLKGLNWLNDEIIHFYLQMIVHRSTNNPKLPKVYAFNTFFYPKLLSGGHGPLKRWTRKVDLFSYDILLIPVHLGVHWCLATVDFRKPGIYYYDSMGGNNAACLEALSKYLEEEHKDKKKASYDTAGFTKLIVKDMPQQMNGSDCGMFSCKTAEYVSRDVSLSFTQKDMPYFRKRMVYEIVSNNLLHP